MSVPGIECLLFEQEQDKYTTRERLVHCATNRAINEWSPHKPITEKERDELCPVLFQSERYFLAIAAKHVSNFINVTGLVSIVIDYFFLIKPDGSSSK